MCKQFTEYNDLRKTLWNPKLTHNERVKLIKQRKAKDNVK